MYKLPNNLHLRPRHSELGGSIALKSQGKSEKPIIVNRDAVLDRVKSL